jgi:hypothetical protein
MRDPQSGFGKTSKTNRQTQNEKMKHNKLGKTNSTQHNKLN